MQQDNRKSLTLSFAGAIKNCVLLNYVRRLSLEQCQVRNNIRRQAMYSQPLSTLILKKLKIYIGKL